MCGLLTDEAGAEERPPGGYNAALTEEQALGPGTYSWGISGYGVGEVGWTENGLECPALGTWD